MTLDMGGKELWYVVERQAGTNHLMFSLEHVAELTGLSLEKLTRMVKEGGIGATISQRVIRFSAQDVQMIREIGIENS